MVVAVLTGVFVVVWSGGGCTECESPSSAASVSVVLEASKNGLEVVAFLMSRTCCCTLVDSPSIIPSLSLSLLLLVVVVVIISPFLSLQLEAAKKLESAEGENTVSLKKANTPQVAITSRMRLVFVIFQFVDCQYMYRCVVKKNHRCM